jgi:hypothetical protein
LEGFKVDVICDDVRDDSNLGVHVVDESQWVNTALNY